MSYSMTVTVANGEATVTTSGPVPDGQFHVSGHDDAQRRDLGVSQRDPEGRYVATASHSHYKEQ